MIDYRAFAGVPRWIRVVTATIKCNYWPLWTFDPGTTPMALVTITQRCHKCHTKVSYKGVIQAKQPPTQVSYKGVIQAKQPPTQVSYKPPTQVSYKGFIQAKQPMQALTSPSMDLAHKPIYSASTIGKSSSLSFFPFGFAKSSSES